MFVTYIKRVAPFLLAGAVGVTLANKLEFIGADRIDAMMRGQETICYDSSDNCKHLIYEGTPSRTNRVAEPLYTEKAKENRVEGAIRLRVIYGANGKVSGVTLLTTLPDGLNEEAVKAAEQIQFTPATFHGIPVSEVKEFEYVFSLDGPFAGRGKFGAATLISNE